MSTNSILATAPLVTTNYLLRATGTTIGNSLIWDNGTNVGIGNTNTSYTLDVSGTGRFASNVIVGGGTTTTSKLTILATTGVAAPGSPTLGIYDASNPTYGFDFDLEGVATGDLYLSRLVAGTRTAVLQLARATGAATFSSSVTATQGSFALGTVGGAIGSVKNLTVTNTNGAIGDWAGLNFAYYNNSTNFAYIGSVLTSDAGNSKSDLVFGTKASTSATSVTEYMRITSGGDLGIGTSTINYATANRRVVEINGTSTALLAFKTGDVAKSYLFQTGTDFIMTNLAAAGGNFVFENNGAERMRITSAGNVGIGTSSPSSLLQLAGGGTGTRGAMRFSDAGLTQYWEIGRDNSVSGDFTFNSNATEKMRITSAGTLQVKAIANTTIGGINTNNTNGDYGYYSEMGGNTSNTSSFHFVGAISGVGNKIQICGNGNLQNTNNSYGAISDAKLKENITDATPKLESLLKVRIRNYNLIGDDNKQIGVIAQELEEVFPSMIDKSNDFDKDGNDLGTTTKSVKYSVFVPMLIKAIQEQQIQIQNLQEQINILAK